MRLTLRTMLAYLDNILDSSDADELSHKIEESKFAGDLVHRIRNSTRRLRLGAPPLSGKGMGLDSNTVAEYLDNTLPPEHVPAFEKVCLESDVHLAEVASCHHILTLVLGRPAEVEDAIRDRAYKLGRYAEPAAGGDSQPVDLSTLDLLDEEAIAGDGADPFSADRSGPLVAPRASSSTGIPLKSLVITVCLAFLLAIVGLRAMGEFDRDHPLLILMAPSPQVTQNDSAAGASVPVASNGPSDGSSDSDASSDTSDGSDADGVDLVTEDEVSDVNDDGHGATEGEALVQDVSEGTSESEDEGTGASVTPSGADVVTDPVAATSADATTTDPTSTDAATVSSSGAPTSEGAGSLARYLSEGQVLGRFDRDADAWFRLQPDVPLRGGDTLVVFPNYRPQILMQNGVKLTIAGASELKIEAADSDHATITLTSGRLLIVPATDTPSRFTVQMEGHTIHLLFDEMLAAAALDVGRYVAPGADPEAIAPQTVVRLFATKGTFGCQVGEGEPRELTGGEAVYALGEDEPVVQAASNLPDWIDPQEWKPIDRRASNDLLGHLSEDRPLTLTLLEQTEFEQQHRVEVRALAARCLVQLGIFDPALKSLSDQRQRAYWSDLTVTLRNALSQGNESAARFEALLVRMYGDAGKEVYRLLRGYSPEQLTMGGGEELVNYLEHAEMSVRVLAYLELKRITGMTHLYLAWQPPGQERDKVAKWRQSLKDGRIVYRTAPDPLPELTTSGAGGTASPTTESGPE